MSNNWVDIKLEKPEFDVPVLVSSKDRVFIARLSESSVVQDKSGVRYSYTWLEGFHSLDECYSTITHWQLLPKPFEG